MYSVLGTLAFADCDGPVVLAVLMFGGPTVDPKPHDRWQKETPKPPHIISFNGTDNGYGSPAGCGSNSIYDYYGHVTWEP
jgi:hypothetical protein